MSKECLRCGAQTTRGDPQVCTPCFVAGWGRLPEMEVGGVFVDPAVPYIPTGEEATEEIPKKRRRRRKKTV